MGENQDVIAVDIPKIRDQEIRKLNEVEEIAVNKPSSEDGDGLVTLCYPVYVRLTSSFTVVCIT